MTGITRRGVFKRAGQVAATSGALSAVALAPTVAQAAPAGQARLNGKLQVVQVLDFHPDHNAFIKQTITDYAANQRWDLDLSDLAGFLGSSNIYDKLSAQKQAGQPVDMIFHGLSARRLASAQLIRDATELVNRATSRWGRAYSSARIGHVVDNKWVGLPFYDRTGGYWLRADKFAEVGKSVDAGDFETWDKVKEALLAVSNPDQNFYGWGMTVNRSGDGESLVYDMIWHWGGALADPTGQLVTLYSPETIDGITYLADIYTNPANAKMLPPGVNSWTDPSNNEAYLGGTVAFTSNAGTVYAKAVFDGNPVAPATDLIQRPLGPFGVRLQGSGGHYFYFMDGAKNFDAAAQLSDFLLSDDIQRRLWQISSGYVVPAYENRWNDPIVMNDRIAQRFKPVSFTDPPFQGLAYRGPVSEAAEAVADQNILTDMMGEILAGKSVDAAVRDAHQRCVQVFQTYGLRGR
jgi:multiple sugar transport system substrate-binding protein